ncbi:MAG: DUF952 domain-containing protein [Verrucomicrobiota bacterium]
MEDKIFKVTTHAEWREVEKCGVFQGAAVDLKDGFIHFSTRSQVVETVAKHFAGQSDLLLIELDAGSLGEELKWEISRGGEHFPHLYGAFSVHQARNVTPLPLSDDGTSHVWPPGFA